MTTKKCPHCGQPNEWWALHCQHCGTALDKKVEIPSKK